MPQIQDPKSNPGFVNDFLWAIWEPLEMGLKGTASQIQSDVADPLHWDVAGRALQLAAPLMSLRTALPNSIGMGGRIPRPTLPTQQMNISAPSRGNMSGNEALQKMAQRFTLNNPTFEGGYEPITKDAFMKALLDELALSATKGGPGTASGLSAVRNVMGTGYERVPAGEILPAIRQLGQRGMLTESVLGPLAQGETLDPTIIRRYLRLAGLE